MAHLDIPLLVERVNELNEGRFVLAPSEVGCCLGYVSKGGSSHSLTEQHEELQGKISRFLVVVADLFVELQNKVRVAFEPLKRRCEFEEWRNRLECGDVQLRLGIAHQLNQFGKAALRYEFFQESFDARCKRKLDVLHASHERWHIGRLANLLNFLDHPLGVCLNFGN